MKKKIWDLYAPIYECAMRADHKTYEFMYARIPEVIRDREVLEIATGPGLLAKRVAPAAKKMIATDYSDAMDLPYQDDSFDAVIIANALHIVPDPEKVLLEIDRVLRPNGILIAPTFVEHKGTLLSRAWSGILKLVGVRFAHQWTAREYLQFLEANGWKITMSRKMSARIALLYAECVKER